MTKQHAYSVTRYASFESSTFGFTRCFSYLGVLLLLLKCTPDGKYLKKEKKNVFRAKVSNYRISSAKNI